MHHISRGAGRRSLNDIKREQGTVISGEGLLRVFTQMNDLRRWLIGRMERQATTHNTCSVAESMDLQAFPKQKLDKMTQNQG